MNKSILGVLLLIFFFYSSFKAVSIDLVYAKPFNNRILKIITNVKGIFLVDYTGSDEVCRMDSCGIGCFILEGEIEKLFLLKWDTLTSECIVPDTSIGEFLNPDPYTDKDFDPRDPFGNALHVSWERDTSTSLRAFDPDLKVQAIEMGDQSTTPYVLVLPDQIENLFRIQVVYKNFPSDFFLIKGKNNEFLLKGKILEIICERSYDTHDYPPGYSPRSVGVQPEGLHSKYIGTHYINLGNDNYVTALEIKPF